MDDVAVEMIMVPQLAVVGMLVFTIAPITYGIIWVTKDATRAAGRKFLGWKSDPGKGWDWVWRAMSLVIGATLGYGTYAVLAPSQWPWGVGLGTVAGLFNIGVFKILKIHGRRKLVQAIVGMEARKAEDSLDEREGE